MVVRSRSRAHYVLIAMVALVASQLAALAPAAAGDHGRSPTVNFAATPTAAPILAHYVVDQRATVHAARTARAPGSRVARELPLRRGAAAARALRASTRSGSRVGNSVGRAPGDRAQASFAGMQSSQSICPPAGCNPPDMAVAASRQWVLQGVNTSFEVLDPRGHVQPGWPRNAQAFFGVPNEPNNCDPGSGNEPFMSDPRTMYDPASGRFWAAMLQVEGALGVAPGCPFLTAYFVAVSQTTDPRGRWNVYEFDMSAGTTNAADFTQLGFDDDAVYFSANMFNQEGTAYEYAELFEANKRQMERGGAAFTASGFLGLTATGPGATYLAATVQPVMTLDSGVSGEYFVNTFDAPDPINGHLCQNAADTCSGLGVWLLRNPTAHDRGGPPPTLTARYARTLPYVFPPAADQPTCTQCIDASDLRISGTPVYRNGTIYAAWETAIDNGSQTVPGIEYAQVNARNTSNTTSSYYAFGGDTAATYPAVMPDGTGRVVMLYDLMSSTVDPQTRYVTASARSGRFTGAGVLVKAGEAPYRPGVCGTAALPVCRWGDFSAASSDGSDRIWLAGQYANGNVGPSTDPNFSSRNWGTWITRVARY